MRLKVDAPRRIDYSRNTTRGILNYDRTNDYPQRVLKIIRDSGHGSLCTSMYARFLSGEGIDGAKKIVVNRKGHTLDFIHEKVVESYSIFRGYALHFNYNANFKITEIQLVRFENCRLGLPDDEDYSGMIAVYNNWDRARGSVIQQAKIKRYYAYNPNPEVIKAQVKADGGWSKYRGQVLYFSADGDSYPLCSLDSVLEDCVTDAQVKVFKYNNVTTNFMASHMLVTKGKSESTDESDDFATSLTQFQGAENTGKIMHIEIDFDEDKPELQAFETVNNDKLFEYTETSVHANIRKKLLIPPVLIGDLIAGKLGTSEEIYDATAFYNSITSKERTKIYDDITAIMARFKTPYQFGEIRPLSLIKKEGKDGQTD